MLDYDLEAGHYDETRGGLPRARAAADAVCRLVPGGGTLLDVACGTGLVTGELAGRGLRVLGVDASAGMARIAAGRVDVVLGDGRALPVRDGSVDAVSTIWLLHLLDDARPMIAEAARVLRRGGVFVTTVDKRAAHGPGGRPEPSDRSGSGRLGPGLPPGGVHSPVTRSPPSPATLLANRPKPVSRRKRRHAKLGLSPTPWRSSWRKHRSRKSARLPRTR
ncbi:methyltransferase domain-containing protein [Nonomuraea phyllanthi]|uniref:class I SAM-dependent methyltransferase n=1 Tax=Nonomuraea phyllanthi TaxID=2219224 RepID=UPI0012932E2C|nr:class I SAM-dependent methyltransferase [Nonomuraea phyllanthi]QFY12240.1 methyltransferase domain-containing protein [Nonomuraea phyllanthi]